MTHRDVPDHPPHLRVELDDDARAARLHLAEGWRDGIGPAGIGDAVLTSLSVAVQRRLLAEFAGASTESAAPVPDLDLPRWGDTVSRAVRDLTEFRIALDESANSVTDLHDDARHVTVTVTYDQVSAIDVDQDWARTANDATITATVSSLLSAGLARADDAPRRALDGCPDLAAVLRAFGSPLVRTAGEVRS